jgi:hypothetical protein
VRRDLDLDIDGVNFGVGPSHCDFGSDIEEIRKLPIERVAEELTKYARKYYSIHDDLPVATLDFWDKSIEFLPESIIYFDFYDPGSKKYQVGFSVHHMKPVSEATFRPAAQREFRKFGLRLMDFDKPEMGYPDEISEWVATASFDGTGLLFSDIFDARRKIIPNLFFHHAEYSDPKIILESIKGGGIERLIGRSESSILEAKSFPYENKTEGNWKFELCQDVSRFANSENGGLLIIGLSTKKIGKTDTIKKLCPFPYNASRIQSYRDVIDAHVCPPIDGLEVESIEIEGGHIVCILIPGQHESQKPYLVQGGFNRGKFDSSVISISRRRGEGSIPITAREIHTYLAAGRALLRNLPRNS